MAVLQDRPLPAHSTGRGKGTGRHRFSPGTARTVAQEAPGSVPRPHPTAPWFHTSAPPLPLPPVSLSVLRLRTRRYPGAATLLLSLLQTPSCPSPLTLPLPQTCQEPQQASTYIPTHKQPGCTELFGLFPRWQLQAQLNPKKLRKGAGSEDERSRETAASERFRTASSTAVKRYWQKWF